MPRTVTVTVGSTTQQPPAAPAAVGFIGDSLTDQDSNPGPVAIRAALVAQGWDPSTRVDGLVGRSIIDGVAPYLPSTQTVINTWRAGGFNPPVWCFALGTNDEWDTDAHWVTKIGTDLDLLTSVPVPTGWAKYVVFWPGFTYRPDMNDTRSTRFIAVLNGLTTARTDVDFRTIDYNALMHNGRDESTIWQASDATGRHMTVAGYTLRNALILPLITLAAPAAGWGIQPWGTSPWGG